MPHETALIATIAGAFVLALAFGFVASKLRIPPLVGYLLAGVAIGPYTPGFVADTALAGQLAEIGVILLMFGVGLHFSIKDLMAVRAIALPGALAQIVTATAIGVLLGHWMGWSLGAGIVFGLALSVASTVVLLRALEERNALDSPEGRIAVGWLIVEDLAMVLALVLLPALAGWLGAPQPAGEAPGTSLWITLGLTALKVVVFVVLVLVVGTRVVPWFLLQVVRTGSRELFTLAILAIALGIAYGSAILFDVSFALGAFFAGVVLSESDLSHQAAADTLPLKDAFAVLFFVSVGMLFDPGILIREPLPVLGVLLIILVGKSLAAFFIVIAFKYPVRIALTISASLAQIGEFSFILAGLGVALGLLPPEGRDLILAGALLSIAVNPLAFAGIRPIMAWLKLFPALNRASSSTNKPSAALRDHAVVVGYGRVGGAIGPGLTEAGLPFVVIENNRRIVESLRKTGIPAIHGDASARGVLELASIGHARLLVIATPDPIQARRILELARGANSNIDTLVRTHSESEREYLERHNVGRVVMGERELALGMLKYALDSLGVEEERARAIVKVSQH